jgi:hypothetical protein
MARAKPQPREDRVAARMARFAGARLSADELDDATGDLENDLGVDGPAPIHDATGKVDMEKLLADLLRALGVEIPEGTDEKGFKAALYKAAMTAISEATGRGAKGANGSAGATGNPLIPGNNGGGDIEPMYMSLSTVAQLPDAAKQIALSLATQLARVNHDRREAARAHHRHQDAQLQEVRDARQTIVNRIFAANSSPAVRREVEQLLNFADRAGAAFSSSVDATPALTTLEQQVKAQLVKDALRSA